MSLKSHFIYGLKLFSIVVGLVACVTILSFTISQLSINISQWLTSNEDSSTLIDLSINSIFVSVTVIYVLATYGILGKTEESLEQNRRNIDENTKRYKQKLIENQLEKFYYPLNDLLKSQFAITETTENIDVKQKIKSIMRIRVDFQNPEIKKSTGLTDIINHQYLAEDGVDELLSSLLKLIYNSASPTDQGLIHYYTTLVSAVNTDIDNLISQLKQIKI